VGVGLPSSAANQGYEADPRLGACLRQRLRLGRDGGAHHRRLLRQEAEGPGARAGRGERHQGRAPQPL